jgi:hypothetical protein
MVYEFVWVIIMPFMDEYSIIFALKMNNKVSLVHTLMKSAVHDYNEH